MDRGSEGIFRLAQLLVNLGPLGLVSLAMSRLASIRRYYLLAVNLSKINLPLGVMPSGDLAPLAADDIGPMLDQCRGMPLPDRVELLARIRFMENGPPGCHLLKSEGTTAYMQWLIRPEQNDLLLRNHAGRFSPLGRNQVMIENAFTFPNFRGRGLYQKCTGRLLLDAREQGYASALCYIRVGNIVSLNETMSMGFRIRKLLTEYRLAGHIRRTGQ